MKFTKNLNYNQKALLGISINIAIILLISYFFIFSYFNKVKTANVMLVTHRVDFETKLIKEEKLSKISKNLIKIQSDIKTIEKAFVDENKKLEFITMLEGLADQNSLDMKMNINFDNIKLKNKSTNLNLTLNGDYSNLMTFLVTIENLDYYMNINHIDLTKSKTRNSRLSIINDLSSGNSLTMKIDALIYWK